VVLPLALPGLVATSIFGFINSWIRSSLRPVLSRAKFFILYRLPLRESSGEIDV